MSVSAADIIGSARKTLCDPEKKHWPDDELMCHLAEALCELAGLRPDVFVESREIELVPGECQKVPEGCLDLVKVEATVGTDGVKTEDGVTKTTTTSGDRLGDKFDCSAATDTPGDDTDETDACEIYRVGSYSVTPTAHGYFNVSPPVPAECNGIKISALVYCDPPSAEDIEDEDCLLPPTFKGQLIDYVLMRAYEKDTESQYAQQRAGYYRRAFYEGVNADYSMASRLRSGYILGQKGDGDDRSGWRREIRGVY